MAIVGLGSTGNAPAKASTVKSPVAARYHRIAHPQDYVLPRPSPVPTPTPIPNTAPRLHPFAKSLALPATPITGATDLINGVLNQVTQTANAAVGTLFGFLTDGVCTASSLLPPPGGLLCDIGLLTFTIHTVYNKPGGGQVVHDTPAIAEVPTLVDITGDGIPDVIVFVGLTSLNQLSIHVIKLLTAPTSVPASIEVVVRDPTNVNSSSRIAVGIDQLAATIPSSFVAAVNLEGLSPLHLKVVVTQSGANAGMTLIGSMFQLQNNGTRTVGMAARVGFMPAPSSMTYDLLLGAAHQHVTYIGSSASKVTGDVSLVSGADEQTVHAVIDQLPTQVDLDLLTVDATHRSVSYSAFSPIASITALYQDVTHGTNGDTLNAEVTGAIQNMPTGLTFQQTGPSTVAIATSGGAIGEIEGGFALGGHVIPLPPNETGAHVVTENKALTMAFARVLGFTSVTIDAPDGGPYYADLLAAQQPIHAIYDDTDNQRTIDAHVDSLPAHLTLSIDPASGHITEDGHGQGISSIVVDGTSGVPFFGRVKHLHAELDGVPASFNLTYTQPSGGFTASIDNPITEISVVLDDGCNCANVPGPITGSGFEYHDTLTQYAIAGRIFGLKAISILTNQPNGLANTPIALESHLTHAQLFTIDVAIATLGVPPVPSTSFSATATINLLPADIALTLVTQDFNGTQATLTYTGSTPITDITFEGQSDPAFFSTGTGAAKHLRAELHMVPAAFQLQFGSSQGTTSFSISNPVTSLPVAIQWVDLAADDGIASHRIDLPGTAANQSLFGDPTLTGAPDSGMNYIDVPGDFAMHGKVFGLTGLFFSPDPMSAEVITAGGHKFDVLAHVAQQIDQSGAPLDLAAEIDTLPADVSISMDTSAGTTLDYNGHGQMIDRIEAAASGPAFFSDTPPSENPQAPVNSAHYLYAKVLSLPAHLALTTMPDTMNCTGTEPVLDCNVTKAPFSLNTFGGAIGKVEFMALDHVPSTSYTPFSTWDENTLPTQPVWHPSSSASADGFVLHDIVDQFQQPVEYTLALQISGLAGASMTGTSEITNDLSGRFVPNDKMTFNLDINKSLAQPFNVDVQTDHPLDKFVAPASDPTNDCSDPTNCLKFVQTSAVSAIEGFIDRPQPQMHLTIESHNPGGPQPDWTSQGVHFGANGCPDYGLQCSIVGTAIHRLHLQELELPVPGGSSKIGPGGSVQTTIDPVGGNRLMADVANVPNFLNICIGTSTPTSGDYQLPSTGSTDQSACLTDRPRPPGYPTDLPTPTGAAPNGWGEMDANHLIVLNVDDSGTSGVASDPNPDATAMIINAYICLRPLDAADALGSQQPKATCDRNLAPATTSSPNFRLNGPAGYFEITNLLVHNAMFDTYAEPCGQVILLCGHIAMDTRRTHFSGTLHFYDQAITVKLPVGHAHILANGDINFPTNFAADYRYTDFRNEYFLDGSGHYDQSRERGWVSCYSDDTVRPSMHFTGDIAGSVTIAGPDIFPRYFCHIRDTSISNPWYPGG